MTNFNIISSLILIGLTFLCFWLPYKSGKKITGIFTSGIIGLIILWTFLAELEFYVIFIWPIIIVFEIIFLSYWILKLFNKKTTGIIVSLILSLSFILIILSPWISDWIFSKKDTKEMLSWHNIELKDDFEILKNESGGFTDYSQTFTLRITDSDFQKISNKIRNSNNFEGIENEFKKQLENTVYDPYDTINFETESFLQREYKLKKEKEDGTFNFVIQLSKKNNELIYFGINE